MEPLIHLLLLHQILSHRRRLKPVLTALCSAISRCGVVTVDYNSKRVTEYRKVSWLRRNAALSVVSSLFETRMCSVRCATATNEQVIMDKIELLSKSSVQVTHGHPAMSINAVYERHDPIPIAQIHDEESHTWQASL